MIMATGATECETEQRLTKCINLLIDDIHLHFHLVRLSEHLGSQRQETGGRHQFPPMRCVLGLEQIASHLFDEKPVERFIAVEGIHHVITVTPRVGVRGIFIQTVAVGIANNIQPMPRPTFTVLGCSHELFDIGLAAWGQTRERIKKPSLQISRSSRGRRFKAGLFQPRKDEAVNRVGSPRSVFHYGQRRLFDRLKSPVLATCLDIDFLCCGQRHRNQKKTRYFRHHSHRIKVRILDSGTGYFHQNNDAIAF